MGRIVVCPHCRVEFEISNEVTEREREVAMLAARGMKYETIGQKLFISEKTVKNHLTNIYAKLDMTNKVDLIKHFIASGEMTADEINMYVEKRK